MSWRGPHILATALGLPGLLACVMPNPEFDRDTLAGGSETTTHDCAGDGDSGPGDGDGDGDSGPGDGDGDSGPDSGPGDGDGDGDSGDGDGDGDGEPEACAAPLAYLDCDLVNGGLTNDPFHALGLACPGPEDATISAGGFEFAYEDPDSWRIATYFGDAPGPNYGDHLWAPRDGTVWSGGDFPEVTPNTSGALLVLSTGTLPEPVLGGLKVEPGSQASNGENLNPDDGQLPPPLSAMKGSNNGRGGTPFMNCDGIHDCSDSLYEQWYVDGYDKVNDALWLRFTVDVPAGVHGYMFDFAFFSSEYPSYVNTEFNDMFVAWSSSEVYTGNLTFIGQAPMNTTSLFEIDGFAHVDQDPALAKTGFEGFGSTSWLLARGPAQPGAQLELTLFVADLGDQALGSAVLLDNFRWDCAGCQGADCGFTP